jgi:hypothetical protein
MEGCTWGPGGIQLGRAEYHKPGLRNLLPGALGYCSHFRSQHSHA